MDKRMKDSLLTAQRLREVWNYDPETGEFTRREKQKGGGISALGVAGAVTVQGYRVLSVDGIHYLAHRLAWLHVHGVWPEKWVGHGNSNKLDNRLVNLRIRRFKKDGKEPLTVERLKQVLSYDAQIGKFFWLATTRNTVAGKEAGTVQQTGYRYISIDSKMHLAHRLAWFWQNQSWPTGQVDHVNGIRDDNRLANLRCASGSQNCHNTVKARSENTTGVRGVSRKRNKFLARITVNRQIIDLGLFSTVEEAATARRAAEIKYLGDFAPVAKNEVS